MRLRPLAFLGVVIAAVAGCPSIKDIYVDMAYPQAESRIPPRDEQLARAATLFPHLLIGYRDPRGAARCLGTLLDRARVAVGSKGEALRGAAALQPFARCLNRPFSRWEGCLKRLPWRAWGVQTGAGERKDRTQRWVTRQAEGASLADAQTSVTRQRVDVPAVALPERPLLPACADIPVHDQVLSVLALADAAEAFYGFAGALGQLRRGRARSNGASLPDVERRWGALARVVRQARDVLEMSPAEGAPQRRAALPALALSGGSANGAFTAGYLHELLRYRELALMHADAATRAKWDARYRFGTLAGTSVGTLVGTIVDLYFSAPDAPAALREQLRSCAAQARVPKPCQRPVQACALALLVRDFTKVEEKDLLCVVDDGAQALLGGRQSALRFDPLRNEILRPFFADYAGLVTTNTLVRVAMTADLQQNVLVGLDERVCRQGCVDQQACLISGVMASIPLPMLAPPQPKVFFGVRAGGTAGSWLDGGLRSGTPALAAMRLTAPEIFVNDRRPRVLAINTHRAGGVPSTGPTDAAGMLLGSIGAMSDQTRQWELSYAQLFDYRRSDKARMLAYVMGAPEADPTPTKEARPTSLPGRRGGAGGGAEATAAGTSPDVELAGNVEPVYVPEDIEPKQLFADGYTFDPYVMKGLFAWGQRSFLRNRRALMRWLGWNKMTALERKDTAFGSKMKEIDRAVEATIAQYRREDDVQNRREHRAVRRRALREGIEYCR